MAEEQAVNRKHLLLLFFVLILLSAGCGKKSGSLQPAAPDSAAPEDAMPAASPNASGPTLKELAGKKGLEAGSAVIFVSHLDNPEYSRVLAREFNLLVVGGSPLNWGGLGRKQLRPSRDAFDFEEGDKIVDFAQKNGMGVQGHHLVWGNEDALPAWLKEGVKKGEFSEEELYSIIEAHISAVAGRYKGKIHEWTVVNEPFTRRLRILGYEDFWYDALGEGYIEFSFRKAREADPEAVLILNDFGNEVSNIISNSMYDSVKELKGKGVPVDAVGMQMHLDGSKPPKKSDVISNMKRFGELGVKVYITELDVDVSNVRGSTQEKWQVQAGIYKDMMEACLESGVCPSFAVFGLTDKESWLNFYGKPDADPLPFDDAYQPKPAYFSLAEALSNP